MADLIVSVSGIRGISCESLTAPVALDFGRAFGEFLLRQAGNGSTAGPLRVALGRDSRISGPMIAQALTGGLLAAGVSVIDLGVTATPTVALMGRFLKTNASVVVTASHNPPQYNGLKFLRHDGIGFPGGSVQEIHQIYQGRHFRAAGIDAIGQFSTDSRGHAHHVQTVLQFFDTRAIAQHRYRVVVDSINGAGCIATPMLLGKLGVELIHQNGTATGLFAHTPEPVRENLGSLCDEVLRQKAVVGFAQDPDADRLALVDEMGNYIGEEYTLALAVYARLLTKPGIVVTNLSTSRMVDDIAARFAGQVIRTPVGEANVAAKMLEVGAVIGGEGNGGVIDLRVGPVRDSFIAMATVLDLLARTGRTLSELVRDLPRYMMIKTKFPSTFAQAQLLVDRVRDAFKSEQLDTQDGVRIDWPQGWVHVRPSNTEPIARVIAEAKTETIARELIGRVEKLRPT
ncbi:MAG: phosphoglucosamine mutase [Phycisphaerae bacterium]|nr:phosphoglucosamine mutase [Phycisphaerae bacterium]